MKHSIFNLVSFVLVSTVAFAANPKLSPDLENVDANSNAAVIVQYTSTPGPAHHEKVTSRGGTLKHDLSFIKSGAYSIPASMLDDLASDPEVVHISLDRKITGALDNTTVAVNAPTAWNAGLSGAGIGVALIDSGITPDADLDQSRVVYWHDWIANDWHDDYGHGTHVAGIIGGTGYRSHCSQCTRNLQGIAPGVNFIDLRVLDQNGAGTDSYVIAAISEAISLKSTYNIRVINLSLGRPVYESYKQDPLCQAVEAAWKAGIVVVVSAGNDGRDNSQGTNGYGTITAPGNDPYVITVGA
ncbi:MAG: S8 family serine peptidase, partial [Acidobacteriaceae bacterium]|nr:S8 family serine peptidase [Acidobacteriaceae bacterium]